TEPTHRVRMHQLLRPQSDQRRGRRTTVAAQRDRRISKRLADLRRVLELATQTIQLCGHRDRQRFELDDLCRARLWIDVTDHRPGLAPTLELERVFGSQ